jgi:methyl-accepting chemotaxis protein
MDKWRRRNYFIGKSFQTRFIIKFCAIVIASSCIITWLLFVLSRNFTTVAIENAHVIVKRTSDFMLPIVVQTVTLVTIFSAFAVVILSLLASHKIAGPVYRLKIEIEKFKSGDLGANFKTRSSDQLQDLSAALAEMGQVLGARHKDLKDKFAQLKKNMGNPNPDRKVILDNLNQLEQVVNYFRI